MAFEASVADVDKASKAGDTCRDSSPVPKLKWDFLKRETDNVPVEKSE